MHDGAGSFDDALAPQRVASPDHAAIGATQRLRKRGRGIEIDAFQQVRILGCRPQRPAIEGNGHARILRINLVGVAAIPDRLALGFALDCPPANVPRSHDALQALCATGGMVAPPGVGRQIVEEQFAAFLATAVSDADRP